MARIPSVQNLQRQIPSALPGIVSDRSGQIAAEGVADIADIFKRRQERKDRFNYGKARSALLQADIETRRSLESDPDWANYETKYREGMKVARETASAMIKDPQDRAFFDQEANLDVERGALAVHGISKQKEGDADRADLDTALQTNRAAALNASDEGTRASIYKSTFDMLKGAADKGSISQDAGNATWLKWQTDTAEARVAMMPVADRIKLLNNPKGTIADLIQPDQRVLLLRAAQNEDKENRVRGASQQASDTIYAAGGSRESMRAKARKIEDPDVRDATITQLEARFGDHDADREKYDRENRSQAWAVILKGGAWNDIPPGLVARMDPEDAVRIKDYLEKSEAGVKTDIPSWTKLMNLAGDEPAVFAEMDLLPYKHLLSEQDYQTMDNLRRGIKEDVRVGDPVQTDNQLVAGALKEMHIQTTGKVSVRDAERAGNFRYAYVSAVNAQFRTSGKKLSFEDKQKIVDRLTMDVVTQRGVFSDSTAPLFEATNVVDVDVPKAAEQEILAAIRNNPARAQAKMRANGLQSEAELVKFMFMLGKGLVAEEPGYDTGGAQSR